MSDIWQIRFGFLVFISFFASGAVAQRIDNIHPEIQGERIYIYYDLSGIQPDQPAFVSVYLSTDGGASYGEPLKSVSGDVGMVTGPGKQRCIIWDVFKDRNELVGLDVKFKVKANLPGQPSSAVFPDRLLKLGMNVNLGYRNRLDYASVGMNLKGSLYMNQLGLGIRADCFRTFRNEINYNDQSEVYRDTGFFWGYSGGAVIEYDLLRSPEFSLYPFLLIGQSKFIYRYNQDYRVGEYFKYSIFGILGTGFEWCLNKHLCLGLELEYMITPWLDLVPSETADEALDGFNLGITLRYQFIKN